jgi:hypothetical protein
LPQLVQYDRPFREQKGYAPLISGNGARNYYRSGYLGCAKDAAVRLLEGKGENRSAMPVLFLFRHYVELALKDTLAQAGAFAIELSNKKFGHDLSALWEETEKVFDNYVIEDRQQIRDVVNELVELDQRADAFRYATNRDEQEHFENLGSVDVKALIESLEGIAGIFEGLLFDMHKDEIEMDEAIREAIARDPY